MFILVNNILCNAMIYKIQEYCKLQKQRMGYKGTKALYRMKKSNFC